LYVSVVARAGRTQHGTQVTASRTAPLPDDFRRLLRTLLPAGLRGKCRNLMVETPCKEAACTCRISRVQGLFCPSAFSAPRCPR
jgi:hypothetical protein